MLAEESKSATIRRGERVKFAGGGGRCINRSKSPAKGLKGIPEKQPRRLVERGDNA
jgi:hypothetical protein